ncbi:MAG: CHAT domain-containing protein [Phaeodactylibacter sp.]|nr:CHAT domain-containing protein [Phaeodactylibacter sp.]
MHLAGSLRAWRDEPPLRGFDDGILYAYEVSNLNLSNTKLVVLSACETGLGDIRGSEGVYGLQRAFKLAGAQHLIMSLWKISDDATVDFMETFYRNWLSGEEMDIRAAFARTQKAMREKYKDPYLWGAFVLI